MCACMFSSVVCVGWRAMGVCLPEGVGRPEVPKEPFSPSVLSHFPERIVFFLSEERDLPIEKHGLCEEHLTQSLTTNTGKWQHSAHPLSFQDTMPKCTNLYPHTFSLR